MYQVFRFLQQKVGPSDERVKKAGFEGPKDRTDPMTEQTGRRSRPDIKEMASGTS